MRIRYNPQYKLGFSGGSSKAAAEQTANKMLITLESAIKGKHGYRFDNCSKSLTGLLIHNPGKPITKLAITGTNGSTSLTFTELAAKGKAFTITQANSIPQIWQRAERLMELLKK